MVGSRTDPCSSHLTGAANPSVAQDIAALIRERYAQELTALQRELRRRAEAL